LFIPRNAGDFVIPAAEYSYFDLQDKTYRTLKTPEYVLKVSKGKGGETTVVTNSFVNKEDVKQLGKDIRFIDTSDFTIEKENEPLFGTLNGWLIFIIPLLISLIIFFVLSKKTKENANIQFVRNKRANKLAQKRLKLAQKLLNEGKKDQFYEEVLKAVWNYLSDKLSIPAAELTKIRIEDELMSRTVNADTVKQITEILNTCEFARYAPNTGQYEMGNLYTEAIDAISNLESIMKKS